MSDYAEVKERLDAFNHWYKKNGGHKSSEFLDLEIADKEITRLRAALEAFPLLPNVPMAEIDKATLLHKVYRWANGPRKQALGEGDE